MGLIPEGGSNKQWTEKSFSTDWSIIWLVMKQTVLHTAAVACMGTHKMVAQWEKP